MVNLLERETCGDENWKRQPNLYCYQNPCWTRPFQAGIAESRKRHFILLQLLYFSYTLNKLEVKMLTLLLRLLSILGATALEMLPHAPPVAKVVDNPWRHSAPALPGSLEITTVNDYVARFDLGSKWNWMIMKQTPFSLFHSGWFPVSVYSGS